MKENDTKVHAVYLYVLLLYKVDEEIIYVPG